MRIRAAFTLHTRSGRCYMAREYDKDGARHTQSTGQPVKPTLNDKGRTLAERAAVQIVPTVRVPTLQEYGRTFFASEQSSYIKRLHAKERSFNRHWAQELQSLLENYVFPRFGGARLDAITRPSVENWLVDLELSNQSKNHRSVRAGSRQQRSCFASATW